MNISTKFWNFLKRLILVIVFVSLFSFAPIKARQAYAWDAIPASFLKQSLEEIYDTIKGVILGAAKTAAVKAINQEINYMVTGGSGGPLIITNYQSFIFEESEVEARKRTERIIDMMGEGRGNSGYTPNPNYGCGGAKCGGISQEGVLAYSQEGFGPLAFQQGILREDKNYARMVDIANAQGIRINVGVGGAQNYVSSLTRQAKVSVLNPPMPTVNYPGNPSQMFLSGNFRNMSIYLSGVNNPWAFNTYLESQNDETKRQMEMSNMAEAIAGRGFKGQKEDGQIITPGAIVENSLTNAGDIGNKVIADAKHLPEIITATVTQMITKTIQGGIGNLQLQVHKNVGNVKANVTIQTNAAAGNMGPAAYYQRR